MQKQDIILLDFPFEVMDVQFQKNYYSVLLWSGIVLIYKEKIQIKQISFIDKRITSSIFTSDKMIVCANNQGQIISMPFLNNPSKQESILKNVGQSITRMLFKNNLLYCSLKNGAIYIMSNFCIIKKMYDAHTDEIQCLLVNEKTIISCSKDKSIKIWHSFKQIKQINNIHNLESKSPIAIGNNHLYIVSKAFNIILYDLNNICMVGNYVNNAFNIIYNEQNLIIQGIKGQIRKIDQNLQCTEQKQNFYKNGTFTFKMFLNHYNQSMCISFFGYMQISNY